MKSHSTQIQFLTNEICALITSFYPLAVRQSLGNSILSLESIKVIPFHLGANDKNAEINHQNCPKGKDSLCRYQNAISHDQIPPKHPKCLSPEAVTLVQIVFTKYRYNTEEFVGQIAQGQTSNHNEAIHNILFSMVRKTDAVCLDLMRLGSALTVIRYNEGYMAITEIPQKLQVTFHPSLIDLLTSLDQNRVEASEN